MLVTLLGNLIGLSGLVGAFTDDVSLFRRGAAVASVRSTTLGTDPPTVNRLNGESFQQDALVTFNGTHSFLLIFLYLPLFY